MKVLFVLNSWFHINGPSNHLFEAIIVRLLRDGWEVGTIEKHGKGQTRDYIFPVPESEKFIRHLCRMKRVEKGRLAERYLSDLWYVLRCIPYYRRNRDADVVFLQSCNISLFHIVVVKRVIKRPVLYNVQDIFPLNAAFAGMMREKGLLCKTLRFLQKQAYLRTDRIVTISEDMKDTLTVEGVAEDKIQVVYNWSESDEAAAIDSEHNRFMRKEGIGDGFKVVYAGNIGAVQNVDIVLKAAQKLKDHEEIRFYIIGGGVRKESLERQARESGLKNVVFYPMQPPEYAPDIYSMADVNVIPLAKGIVKTALPSKTAYCLACGKPVVACIDRDSRFARMLETCGGCSVVDSGDPEGLAECILKIFKEGTACPAEGGAELFRSMFSKTKNVERYAAIIAETAKMKNFGWQREGDCNDVP